ncbi:MAG: adenylate/guanylate cyclase domain-containing protein [Chloroflexota bacterium]
MPPPIEYAKSGELFIAYQITGDGPVDLIWAPGASSHLELQWENPYFVRMIDRLSTFCRLIRFDKRGTGMSDRPSSAATLEERTDDIRAILDSAKSQSAHLFGVSEGGSMTMLFAAMYPRRTRSLALWGALPRWTSAPDYPWGPTPEEQERAIDEREARGPQPYTLTDEVKEWLGPVHHDPVFFAAWAKSRASGATPAMRVALSRMNARIDVRAVLPTIQVPTLWMNRTGDPDAQIGAARYAASLVPGAHFLEFPGVGHLFFDIWDDVASELERFITGAQVAAPTDRVLATILFLDIVGSTERVAAVGDAVWRNLLERYYAFARRELVAYAGVEVDTAGDGLLARFDGPARAIRCARAIQRQAKELALELRAGVHTGEVELSGTAIRGIAVHTASRIASLAGPGEVYTSSTVRDLVAGSGIAFQDRGVHTLKGIPEPRQVLTVA